MSSNPYGQGPGQSGSYEDYSQGYAAAPQPPYDQQPQAPYVQPSTPAYGQPTAPAYGQPTTPTYGQPTTPTYGQPTTPGYGQVPTTYGQSGYAGTYAPTNYEQPTYGQPDPYGQPYSQPFVQSPAYPQQYGQALAPYSAISDSSPRPSVTMGQAVRLWLKNWKNFSGRASRSEYWWVALAAAIVSMVFALLFVVIVVAAAASGTASDSMMAGVVGVLWGVMALLGLATVVPTLSLGIRRLHDTNQSGWMYLLNFVPYVGGIILIVLMAQASNPAAARFDDPAQPVYGPEDL
ncbi:MAG: DUF805 domain-containing protein [Actinobacteria bacterium]|nr:DUF805 domain-containing protein [Actinomycetota bacterium]